MNNKREIKVIFEEKPQTRRMEYLCDEIYQFLSNILDDGQTEVLYDPEIGIIEVRE